MIKLYIMDISRLPDPLDKPDLLENLSRERQFRITKMKDSVKRRQSLGAGILLGNVLKRSGLDAEAVKIGNHGKPEIEGLYFNLSHSADLVICATSDEPIGCDVEKKRQMPERFDENFLRLWTIQESYSKMTGEGFAIPKGELEIILDDPISILRCGERQPCYIQEIAINEYMISICSGEESQVEVVWEE